MVPESVEKDKILYEVRLSLFGLIPLWKVKRTKRELKKYALISSNKKRMIELEFIDRKEVY